jgi:hypothetical protein
MAATDKCPAAKFTLRSFPMQAPQKVPGFGTVAAKSPASVRTTAHAEKLASFLLHHHHLNAGTKTGANQFSVDVKGNRNVAEHLQISHDELESAYEELLREKAIRRHGEYRVEILDKARLTQLGSNAKL